MSIIYNSITHKTEMDIEAISKICCYLQEARRSFEKGGYKFLADETQVMVKKLLQILNDFEKGRY